MASITTGSFYIQSDWQDVLMRKPKQSKFWLRFVQANGQSIDTFVAKSSDGSIICEDLNVEVSKINERSLKLKHLHSQTQICIRAPEVEIKLDKKITSLATSPDGSVGIYSYENDLHIFDFRTGEIVKSLRGHLMDVECVHMFANGLLVLSGAADMMVKLWTMDTGAHVKDFLGHTRRVTRVHAIPSGKAFVSSGADGQIIVWNPSTGKPINRIDADRDCVTDFQISSHLPASINHMLPHEQENDYDLRGKIVVACRESGKLSMISLVDAKEFKQANTEYRLTAIESTIDDDDLLLIVGTDCGTLLLWSSSESKIILEHCRPKKSAVTVIAAIDHERFAVAFADGTLIIYVIAHRAFVRLRQLTGADCDPIYSIQIRSSELYAACRDGVLRKYSITM